MVAKAPPISPHDNSTELRPSAAYKEQIRLDGDANDSDSIQDGDFNSNGQLTRIAVETYAARQTVGTEGIGVADGTGAAGNPTVSLDYPAMTMVQNVEDESDLVAIYDDSAGSHKKILIRDLPGLILQRNVITTSLDASATIVMVVDDTIPQITEGEELFRVQILPNNIGNFIEIEVFLPVISQSASTDIVGAIFHGTDVDAISATVIDTETSTSTHNLMLRARVQVTSLAQTFYSFRYGGTSGTTFVNSNSSGGRLSTSTIASITATEYSD